MARKISVSVMCSDLMNLGEDVRRLERLGVDWLHVDIMDAHFVPNLTFGPDVVNAMHEACGLPLDIHLMTDFPELIFGKLHVRAGDSVSAHVELGRSLRPLADDVHALGAHFGVVLNPATDVEALRPYMPYADMVTMMLVQPGFAGARLVEGILDKVRTVREWLDKNGFQQVIISVDGSVSCERAALMAAMGAEVFVGGTAGIYRRGMQLEDTVPAFRKAIS